MSEEYSVREKGRVRNTVCVRTGERELVCEKRGEFGNQCERRSE